MSDSEANSPIREKTLIDEQDTEIIPLSEEEVLVPGIADKHPRDMPEMAFIIAFCVQYNEAVGNLSFPPEVISHLSEIHVVLNGLSRFSIYVSLSTFFLIGTRKCNRVSQAG